MLLTALLPATAACERRHLGFVIKQRWSAGQVSWRQELGEEGARHICPGGPASLPIAGLQPAASAPSPQPGTTNPGIFVLSPRVPGGQFWSVHDTSLSHPCRPSPPSAAFPLWKSEECKALSTNMRPL